MSTLEESLKNVLFTGLGVAVLTKEKIEHSISNMVERGAVTREEGRKLYDELSSEATKAGKEFSGNLKDQLREWLVKTGIPTQEEFQELKNRISELESIVSKKENS